MAVFVLCVLLYRYAGLSWWIFAALFLAPDLSMGGYLINRRFGGYCYNAVHSYVLPVSLAAMGVLAGRSVTLPWLCIWVGHIGFDRGLGYGLKYPAGFGQTHLGAIGKARATASQPAI